MKIGIKTCNYDAYMFIKPYYLETEMGPKHCLVQHFSFKGKETEAWKSLPASHLAVNGRQYLSNAAFGVSNTQAEIHVFLNVLSAEQIAALELGCASLRKQSFSCSLLLLIHGV